MTNLTEFQGRFSREEYISLTEAGHGGCPGCGVALALRYFLKAMEGEVIMVIPPGCTPVIVMSPEFNLGCPVLVSLFGSTAVLASGLKSAFVLRGEEEIEVVGWGGDGATFDIGLQVLSGAAERNEDIIYVCCDNEAYQNTGNQRSSASPSGGLTSTNPLLAPKREGKKDIMAIMAGHNIPYAATGTIAYPQDLMEKVRKARKIRGFRFIHILGPCVTGWQYPANLSIEVSRLAVETGVFPLFEVENGTDLTINSQPSKTPVQEYLKIQGRFRHLSSFEMDQIQSEVNRKWSRLEFLATYNKSGGSHG